MDSKSVYRTTNACRAAVEDMNIYHRRLDVAMAQEFLDRSNIVPSFEQVSGKGIPIGLSGFLAEPDPAVSRSGAGISATGLHGAGSKGTCLKGQRGESLTVPGLQSPYEAPSNPDLRIDSTTTASSDAARRICDLVKAKFL